MRSGRNCSQTLEDRGTIKGNYRSIIWMPNADKAGNVTRVYSKFTFSGQAACHMEWSTICSHFAPEALCTVWHCIFTWGSKQHAGHFYYAHHSGSYRCNFSLWRRSVTLTVLSTPQTLFSLDLRSVNRRSAPVHSAWVLLPLLKPNLPSH